MAWLSGEKQGMQHLAFRFYVLWELLQIFYPSNTKIYFVYRQFEQNKNFCLPLVWPTSRIISLRGKTVFKIVDEAKFYGIICSVLTRNLQFGRYRYVC